MIHAQAEAAGIELRAIGSGWRDMEGRLTAELTALRSQGYTGVVFGDIYLADGQGWFEERVRAAGLEFIEPIRGEAAAELLREFVETGGRAVITCVDLTRLDRSWLGRIIDERFPNEIETTGADPCGENGEYHSFVFQGPVFKHPVSWRSGEIRSELGFSQLDVLPG
jgi:uncharacterized protein (TIGR00290 family)